MKKLDIIIPVKNEAKNIASLIDRIDKVLSTAKIPYSIVIIDDRSTDETPPIVKLMSKKYPISFYLKEGKSGKSFCILEGVKKSTAPYIVMIDADLQYSPDHIPAMYKKILKDPTIGIVVADRKIYQSGQFRRLASRLCAFLFGRLLFGINIDVQSGLKLFKREVVEYVDESCVGPWSLDIPLLFTALELGYNIDSVDITFEKRKNGESKISLFNTALDIAVSAIKQRLRKKNIYLIKPKNQNSMLGAGLVHRRRQFITHTTLPHTRSALKTFNSLQKDIVILLAAMFFFGLIVNIHLTIVVTIAILSTIYFLDVIFNLGLVVKSLSSDYELRFSPDQINKLKDSDLPIYSILCPLYKEAHILPQFVTAISMLDWPINKLDVLLLLEEDDIETIKAAQALNLPEYFRIVVVPHSQPKTKPKAANYGLHLARGEYVVIFDAEDIPDPLQLKKVYLGFKQAAPEVICFQAKLNYYNPHHNLLTRLFTAEYSLWFDVFLTGLQSINTAIPLGGTSNHFRRADLIKLTGWDPFNVTEDCDLGARLFKTGYKTAIIDSTTLEEANSHLGNWLRQRSRWIKGYIQTYFVHMREPVKFIKKNGWHYFIFQLVVGGKIAFMFINPILWAATIAYFTLYSLVGPTIESLYPAPVFYMAATSLVLGNFLFIYYYMIGCAKRQHWALVKYVFFVPIYWLFVSVAAVLGLTQLIFKPHYWEKTRHGLHLKQVKKIKTQMIYKRPAIIGLPLPGYLSGGLLIVASVVGNFFNFLYNAYLGRAVSVEEFGLVSLISSLLYLTSVPLGALSKAVTYKAAFYFGRHKEPATEFWLRIKRRAASIAIILTGLWILLIPATAIFFKTQNYEALLLFAPVWLFGTVVAVDGGFLSGSLHFTKIALIALLVPLSKFIITYLLVNFGLNQLIYAAIPLSVAISAVIAWFLTKKAFRTNIITAHQKPIRFPRRFFLIAIMTSLSTTAFLSFDVILSKHYLSATQAGQYGLLSLAGKMIFFVGALFSQFITPLVSRDEGAGVNSKKIFYQLLLATAVVCFIGFIAIGIYGFITIPLLLGARAQSIVPLLPAYTLAMVFFTISMSIVSYHQVKKEYLLSWASVVLAFFQIVGIALFHRDLSAIVTTMLVLSTVYLFIMSVLHLGYKYISVIVANFTDIYAQFTKKEKQTLVSNGNLNILILNWRDMRHVWAGGAEVYVHELGKRWVKEGNKVTVFCGNDRKCPSHEVIDGVEIIRRGGFFTVYIWAIIYYLFKFRGKYDVVVDSENGIPFFTPLFVRVPKFLLIHHVHQEVFREHLPFPMSTIAMFIESHLMPFLYKNQHIITVSESSKKDIISLGFTQSNYIDVISPGVDTDLFFTSPKTIYPSFIYLGRLKPYKNIDVILKAFVRVVKNFPTAQLFIVGEGESGGNLKKMAVKIGIDEATHFLGKVADVQKAKLLASSWVALQPSSFEGFGLTVIEANASATPVIASDVPGLCDSVVHGQTGILVSPKSVEQFALAMQGMIVKDQQRKKMSRQAFYWAQNFSWHRSAKFFFTTMMRKIRPDYYFGFSGKLNFGKS